MLLLKDKGFAGISEIIMTNVTNIVATEMGKSKPISFKGHSPLCPECKTKMNQIESSSTFKCSKCDFVGEYKQCS